MKTLNQLLVALSALPQAPADAGALRRIVVRPGRGTRETPDDVVLDPETGIDGDRWRERAARYGARYAERQVTLIRADVARVLTEPIDAKWTGDNFHVDIDLSTHNLPAGSRLQIGDHAVIEISTKPHSGCKRFRERFGDDAARVNSHPDVRDQRIRGALARVIVGGHVKTGDRIQVVRRGVDDNRGS
ncbi:MAG: MOSC domain-containing protein [Myxococcota bacterium]